MNVFNFKTKNSEQLNPFYTYKERDTFKLFLIALNIICWGIFICFLDYILPDDKKNSILFWKILHIVVSKSGEAIIVFGIGTIALEFSGFVKYTKNRLKEIVIEHDFLSKLKPDKLKEIKLKIESHLYPLNAVTNTDSLLHVIQKNVNPLLDSYFYKEYIVDVNVEIEDGYIKKTIYKKIVFSQYDDSKEQIIGTLFDIHFFQPKSDNKSPLNLISFSFNKKNLPPQNLLEEMKLHLKHEEILDDGKYKQRFILNCDDLKFKEDVEINLTYNTFVPLTDRSFINRVEKPCQHYCIHFNYDKKQFKLFYSGFAFADLGNIYKKDVRTSRNSLMIRFKDWILPGDGTMFVLLDKECK